jgi:hypothetical protein
MKPRTLMMAGGAALLIAAGVMLLPRAKDVRVSGETPRTEKMASQPAKGDPRESVATPKPVEPEIAKESKLTDEERIGIFNEIEQASVTYDAKALPSIEPYLLHPDPEVRQAAMNGMVVLGDAAAGPLLRKAAEKAPTPKEAVALTEAADYIELPAGTLVPKERTAPGTRKPTEGKPGERSRPRLRPSAKPEAGSQLPEE